MTDKSTMQVGELYGAYLRCQNNPPHRILVVEDDRDLRQINAMVLHHAGYHIDTLEDSASAWEALQSKCYDLLVIDHNTQNVSGIDLIQKLHASHMAMPVIMTTRTFPMWELALNPWLYPATVLFKPYSIEQLLGVVETALRTADIACAEFAPPLNLPLTGNLRV